MKRFHVHVAVENLEQSVKFYSALFASEPTVLKPDYAKWMLENPRVNFAISQREGSGGVQHLGIQVEGEDELNEVYGRLTRADGLILEEKATTCCYAVSDKRWVADPQGIAWETFLTHGETTFYGGNSAAKHATEDSSAVAETCCARKSAKQKSASPCCTVAAE